MTKNSCKFEYLSSSIYGDVSLCQQCKIVHLNFNNLSLKFSVEDFLGVSGTLAEATKMLHVKGQTQLSLIKCH